MTTAASALGPRPMQFFGGWEAGLLVMMMLLYLAGAFINPNFFGSLDAFQALLRDSARYAVMAVGMTFVIANKDLDLSVGSTFGLVTVIFAYAFNPAHYDMGVGTAIVACFALGTAIGLINGILVTILRVPAFIATLTMLFIGRGFVLGLTGGQSILYPVKAREFRWFFQLGEFNAWGFNNQIPIALVVVAIGAFVLAKTRWGYETFATGGNEQAAIYAGIPTRWVQDTRLSARIVVRHDRRPDGGGAGQGHLPAVRPERRADRHRLGHHRRRVDPRRPRPCPRQLPRRGPGRADQQGVARRLADHPHAPRQRRGSAGPGGLHVAGRRGSRVPRHAPDPRRADRADPHPQATAQPPLGAPSRPASAARARYRRRRDRRRADQGEHGDRQGGHRARLRKVPGAARRAGDHPHRRPVAGRPLPPARLLVEPAEHASRSSSTTPSSR